LRSLIFWFNAPWKFYYAKPLSMMGATFSIYALLIFTQFFPRTPLNHKTRGECIHLLYHSFFNFVALPLLSTFPLRSYVSLLIPPIVYILPSLISYVFSSCFPSSISPCYPPQLKL
jgi:hypothetical protein